MAPTGQTSAHGGWAQCRQTIGTLIPSAVNHMGVMRPLLGLMSFSFAKEQASMQNPQPVHFSGSISIIFFIALLLRANRYLGYISMDSSR